MTPDDQNIARAVAIRMAGQGGNWSGLLIKREHDNRVDCHIGQCLGRVMQGDESAVEGVTPQYQDKISFRFVYNGLRVGRSPRDAILRALELFPGCGYFV